MVPFATIVMLGTVAIAIWDAQVLIRARRTPAAEAGSGSLRRWRVYSTVLWSSVLLSIPIGLWVLGESGIVVFAADDWKQRAATVIVATAVGAPVVMWFAHSRILKILGLGDRLTSAST